MALTNTLDRSDAQVSPAMACTYIFTQICASVCSTYTLSMLFNHLKVPNNPLGVPVPGDGATVVGALLMETVCTFSLTMCILILMIHGEDTDNEKEGAAASGRDVLKKGKHKCEGERAIAYMESTVVIVVVIFYSLIFILMCCIEL